MPDSLPKMSRFVTIATCWVASLLMWALTLSATGLSARAEGTLDDASYHKHRESLSILLREVRELRGQIDETRFEPDALAQALGADPGLIFDHVQGFIAFEPYLGALRHADGALMSRAANSFDQASLLAAALRAAGQEVRLARGSLDNAAAWQLYGAVHQPPPDAVGEPLTFPAGDPVAEGLLRVLGATDTGDLPTLRAAAEQDGAAALSAIGRGLVFDSGLVMRRLGDAGLFAARRATDAAAAEESAVLDSIRDHGWVQLRVGDSWVDLDPSAHWLDWGERLAEPSWTGTAWPDDLLWKIGVRASVERKAGTETETETLFNRTARLGRAVNEIAVILLPEFDSRGMLATYTDPDRVRAFDSFRSGVRINGDVRPGAVFDLNGRILPSDPEARSAAELGEGTGAGLVGLTDALTRLEDSDRPAAAAEPELAAVHLETRLIAPDGTVVEVIPRVLASTPQLSGAEARASMRDQLLTRHELLATGSRIARAYIQARYIDTVLSNRELLFLVLAEAAGREVPNAAAILENRTTTIPFELLDLAYTRAALMDANAVQTYPELSVYPHVPQVLGFSQRLSTVDGPDGEAVPVLTSVYDIQVNRIRALDPWDRDPDGTARREVALEQGVLDTLAEYILGGGGQALNARAVTAAAVRDGVPIRVIEDEPAIGGLPVTDVDRVAMARDLQEGFVLLAPEAPVRLPPGGAEAPLGYGWWRVHPGTGETLGMASGGLGASKVEYVITTGVPLVLTNLIICTPTTLYFTGIDSSAIAGIGLCVAVSTALTPVAGKIFQWMAPAGGWAARSLGYRAAGLTAGAGAGGLGARAVTGSSKPATGTAARPGARPEIVEGVGVGEGAVPAPASAQGGGGGGRPARTTRPRDSVDMRPRQDAAGAPGQGERTPGPREAVETPGVTGEEPGGLGGRLRKATPDEGLGVKEGPVVESLKRLGVDESRARTGAVVPSAKSRSVPDAVARAAFERSLTSRFGRDGIPPSRVMEETGMTEPQLRASLDSWLEQGQNVRDPAKRRNLIDRYFAMEAGTETAQLPTSPGQGQRSARPPTTRPPPPGQPDTLPDLSPGAQPGRAPGPAAEAPPPGIDPYGETVILPREQARGPAPAAEGPPPGIDPYGETVILPRERAAGPAPAAEAPPPGINPEGETVIVPRNRAVRPERTEAIRPNREARPGSRDHFEPLPPRNQAKAEEAARRMEALGVDRADARKWAALHADGAKTVEGIVAEGAVFHRPPGGISVDRFGKINRAAPQDAAELLGRAADHFGVPTTPRGDIVGLMPPGGPPQ